MSSTLSIFLTMVCLSTWAAATVRLAEEIERINARIDELQKKHSNFVQRQSNQSQHSSISCKSHFQLPQKTDNPSKILCSHTSFNISSHIFQTSKQIYVVVNHPTTRQFEVYNAKCVHLASADKVVLRVLCDRGVCQNGKVYFIATDYTLNVMNEDQNFTVILSLGQVSAANNYVGAVIRHKYPDKEQIFIGEHRGLVKYIEHYAECTTSKESRKQK